MEQIKKIPKRYNDIFCNDFRKLISEKLGDIDTAYSFMYLYRRFGEPNFTNKNDYKIMYEYWFKHNDLFFVIHASYHTCVYFNLFVPQQYLTPHIKYNNTIRRQFYKKAAKRNIAYIPYSTLFFGLQNELTKKQQKDNWNIVNKEFDSFFSKEDKEFINNVLEGKDNINKNKLKAFSMLEPFKTYLYKKFRKILTLKERNMLDLWPKMKNFSKIRKTCLSFIRELKKGVWVRDAAFNIKGYQSKKNDIFFFVHESET